MKIAEEDGRVTDSTEAVKYNIRGMEPTDAEGVLELLARFPECAVIATETPELLRKQLELQAACNFVAVVELADGEEGPIVGAVVAGITMMRGVIDHIAVDPNLRNCGIGSKLLKRAVAGIHGRGIRRVHALLTDGNPAFKFWDFHGYVTPPGERAMCTGQAAQRFVESDLPAHLELPPDTSGGTAQKRSA